MFRSSPRRNLRPRTVVPALPALVLILAGIAAGAAPAVKKMPGGIPGEPPRLSGFPIPFHRTTDYRTSDGAVVAADLDGDGRVELVVGVPSGLLTVIGADGARRAGWPRLFTDLPQPAYPLGEPGIGDLDGDGSPEIVACVMSGSGPRRALIFAFRADGTTRPGWPVEPRGADGGALACAPNATLLADLDGDRSREVVQSLHPEVIVAIDGDGRALPGWPFRPGPDPLGRARTINSSLAAADLDGDGRAEVIAVESGVEPRLFVLDGRGRPLAGFPRSLPQLIDRQAPGAGDLDGDGLIEIVQSTSSYSLDASGEPIAEPDAGSAMVPGSVHVLHLDGSARAGWPAILDTGGTWGAAIADLNGDLLPDVVQQDGDLLRAYDAWGRALPRFPLALHREAVKAQSVKGSPWIAADADGDGRPDLLSLRTYMWSGSSSLRAFALDSAGHWVHGFPFDAEGLAAASVPAVADLSGDGIADLAFLAWSDSEGWFTLEAWDLGALAAPQR